MRRFFATIVILLFILRVHDIVAQSADWQTVVWREPQVRYLIADMTLGGNTKLYRDYGSRASWKPLSR